MKPDRKIPFLHAGLGIILAFFCLVHLDVNCQIKPNTLESTLNADIPFVAVSYNKKEGIIESNIYSLNQLANGNLLMSTANGMLEFDGYEFKNLNINNGNNNNGGVRELYLKKSKPEIFAGKSYYGLVTLFNNPKLVLPSHISGVFSHDSIFLINANGDIFASGIAKYNFKKLGATGIKDVSHFWRLNNGFLLQTSGSMYLFKSKPELIYTHSFNRSYKLVKYNKFDKKHYLLLDNSILTINSQDSLELVCQIKSDYNFNFTDIAFISRDSSVVSSNEGIYKLIKLKAEKFKKNKASYTHKHPKTNPFYVLRDLDPLNTLPTRHFTCMYWDEKRSFLYLGTLTNGLLRLTSKDFFFYKSEQSLDQTRSYISVALDRNDNIVVNDVRGHFYRIVNNKANLFLKHRFFLSMTTNFRNDIIVSVSNRGIYALKKNKLQLIDTGLKNFHSYCLTMDSKGTIWLGGEDGVIYKNKGNNFWKKFTKANQKTLTIRELRNGNICMAGTDGVFIYNKEKNSLTKFKSTQAGKWNQARALYEDISGKLWVGTYGAGLFCIENNKMKSISLKQDCKLGKEIFTILKDSFGYLNITTNNGLLRIKEADLSAFYDGNIPYLIPFVYDDEAGLFNTEFNGGNDGKYTKNKKGEFIFPNFQGCSVFIPKEEKKINYKCQIDQIYVNDTLTNPTALFFKPTSNRLEIRFSCTNLSTKNNLYYQYRLLSENKQGEKNWSSLQKERRATFSYLPSGKYTFQVRAVDAFNESNPNITSLPFEIDTVFYKKNWFILLSSLLTIAIIVFSSSMVYKSQYRKKIKKEEIQNQISKLELMVVQSQLNPHFIFNCLNSLKYLLAVGNNLLAESYIDDFSYLLRSYLDKAKKDFILVNAEIEILSTYCKLESLRSNSSFDFEINANERVLNMEIPTNVLQPFVENAIKHGINNSFKTCKLSVTFNFNEMTNSIFCQIDDNGVGRKKAAQFSNITSNHSSMGIKLVDEKIRIMQRTYGATIRYEIIDKTDEKGFPKGTSVNIYFGYINPKTNIL